MGVELVTPPLGEPTEPRFPDRGTEEDSSAARRATPSGPRRRARKRFDFASLFPGEFRLHLARDFAL